MTYRGHVRNGQICFDPAIRLPEGAPVNVEVIDDPRATRRGILDLPKERRRQLLSEQAERVAAHYASEADRSDWQGGDILE